MSLQIIELKVVFFSFLVDFIKDYNTQLLQVSTEMHHFYCFLIVRGKNRFPLLLKAIFYSGAISVVFDQISYMYFINSDISKKNVYVIPTHFLNLLYLNYDLFYLQYTIKLSLLSFTCL